MDGIIVLVVVVLVLFGSTQIPKLARSLGSAQREFKKGVDQGASPDPESEVAVLVASHQATVIQPGGATVEVAAVGPSAGEPSV
jgi:sec-independent protein translocase protein TatA